VLLLIPTLYTLVGVILAYPWFFVPLLVVVTGWCVDRRNRRRAAIAARADYEHRELIARAVLRPPPFAPVRRRPAYPRSMTEPIRVP
jgi:hypothetical protein